MHLLHVSFVQYLQGIRFRTMGVYLSAQMEQLTSIGTTIVLAIATVVVAVRATVVAIGAACAILLR